MSIEIIRKYKDSNGKIFETKWEASISEKNIRLRVAIFDALGFKAGEDKKALLPQEVMNRVMIAVPNLRKVFSDKNLNADFVKKGNTNKGNEETKEPKRTKEIQQETIPA